VRRPRKGRSEERARAGLTTEQVAAAGATAEASKDEPLIAPEELEKLRGKWEQIQTTFVDEPHHSVEQADRLVAEVMQRLAKSFADERSQLEGQWDQGEDVSTEQLRLAFTRYRSFFNRLLSA
jgi:hypothetical protein